MTKQQTLNKLAHALAGCAEINNAAAYHVLLAMGVELDHGAKRAATDTVAAFDAFIAERKRCVRIYRGLTHWEAAVVECEGSAL